MTEAFTAARRLAVKSVTVKLAVVLAATAVVAVGVRPAEAAKRKVPVDQPVAYTTRGPNVTYMAGPRTRVYITKRSWLDAGVEVMPGDRKFTDYALPPPQSRSFGLENLNRPLDRQPLSPPWDLGGYPTAFPLY
jgi:hypothetical protein